ncbi:MAG: PAS domain-containing protein [Hyphomicrobiales bacterium]|nr:PAS domain-containing protein [Hyphomicrobiales bacterium]
MLKNILKNKPVIHPAGPLTRKFASYVRPTGHERTFHENEIIVTKTDTAGKITYANDVFLRVAAVTEKQAIGAPHSIIRHPDMPRAVFKLLWDTIEAGREIFAYVVNMASNGDHYWVFAHVTPSYDQDGMLVGYHSSRRLPERRIIPVVTELYAALLAEEQRHQDRRAGLEASVAMLVDLLQKNNVTYDEFVFSL